MAKNVIDLEGAKLENEHVINQEKNKQEIINWHEEILKMKIVYNNP